MPGQPVVAGGPYVRQDSGPLSVRHGLSQDRPGPPNAQAAAQQVNSARLTRPDPSWIAVDYLSLSASEKRAFSAGFGRGFFEGIGRGRRQRDAELQPLIDALVTHATDTDARDERLARRIRALQLEHDAIVKTTAQVVRTLSYVDRRRLEWARSAERAKVEKTVPTPGECLASWAAA